MKLVLKEDIHSLGRMGEVVEVADGYARNYLLPRRLATTVSEANLRQIESQRRRLAGEREQEVQELQGLAEQLAGGSFTIAVKANPEGHLFGSVGARQIADTLAVEGFARVTEEMIVLEEPIRELGVIEVPVRLSEETSATCKVWIVQE